MAAFRQLKTNHKDVHQILADLLILKSFKKEAGICVTPYELTEPAVGAIKSYWANTKLVSWEKERMISVLTRLSGLLQLEEPEEPQMEAVAMETGHPDMTEETENQLNDLRPQITDLKTANKNMKMFLADSFNTEEQRFYARVMKVPDWETKIESIIQGHEDKMHQKLTRKGDQDARKKSGTGLGHNGTTWFGTGLCHNGRPDDRSRTD
jgi:hypothetical protein